MSQAFAHQLGLKILKTNVGAQKIDSTTLKTYNIVVSTFFILNKNSRERFFEKSFLFADVKPNIVLGILFLSMSNIDIDFQAWDLQLRFYTTEDVFSTTKQVKLIEKKEFVIAALNLEHKAFIVHIAALNIDIGDKIHLSKKAQIAHLKANEALFKVFSEYADFADIFSPKLTAKLSEHTRINNHIIELMDNW